MFKKLIVLIVIFSCVTAQGDLVNRYSFNDGDTAAIDSVGGKDGILSGTATISGNRLVLDGSTDCAAWLPSDTLSPALTDVSIECWVEVSGINTWARAWDFGGTVNGNGGDTIYFVANNGGGGTQFTASTTGFPSWQTGEQSVTSDGLVVGEMTHVVCVFDSSVPETRMYIDGALAASGATTMDLSLVARENAYIGDSSYTGDPGLNGSVDEFRIYDTALSDGEVLDSFSAGPDAVIPIVKAGGPSPSNGKVEVPREVVLSWIPGDYADTHNVYLGTDAALVAAGDASVLIGDGLTDALLDIGVQKYGDTIFWRVDEVNAADSTVYEGNVWSFTIEAYGYPIPASSITASASSQASADEGPENTINGSGITDGMASTDSLDNWLSADEPNAQWIQYDFDKAYKLVQMQVWNYNGPIFVTGLGIKDVNFEYSMDGVNWDSMELELAQATGAEDYTGETIALDIGAKSVRLNVLSGWGGEMFTQYGLSEIKFFSSPVRATNPDPASGATGQDTNLTLGWKPGRGADEHHVYISTNEQEVVDLTAPATVVTDPEVDAVLSLANTYYWTVVEVNNNNTPAEWPTDVWNLSTVDYFAIDDFEADSLAWSASGGASVADTNAVAHSGKKSMKLDFNNSTTVGVSEAKLSINKSLTKGDPTAIVFWVYGVLGNIQTEQMYVKIADNKNTAMYKNVVATSEMATPWWTQVTVLMDDTAINWTNVKSISIGLIRASKTSGSGTVYIDDVRLYRIPPVPVTPSNPGTSNLVAYYKMENNADDSSGNGINGTAIGEPNYVSGPFPAFGSALECDGVDDVIDLGQNEVFNFAGSFSVSYWANIQDWSSGWGCVMVGNRGEDGIGWQIRRGGNDSFCFTTRGISNDDMYSNQAPPLNEWVNFACVYDSDAFTKAIYFNSELIRQIDLTGDNHVVAPTTHNTYIGARANRGNTGPESLFTGDIDEVRIYDKALTNGEVKFLNDPTP